MTPIDIQVSRIKVKVKGQPYSIYVGEGGGALVFYKHLYFTFEMILRYFPEFFSSFGIFIFPFLQIYIACLFAKVVLFCALVIFFLYF